MANKKHEDMTWREFEKEVEEDVERHTSDKKYRVESQRSSTYSDGETKRMDIHVAERRQGGNHHVVDAKHFNGDLPASEIVDTKDYQRRRTKRKVSRNRARGRSNHKSSRKFLAS